MKSRETDCHIQKLILQNKSTLCEAKLETISGTSDNRETQHEDHLEQETWKRFFSIASRKSVSTFLRDAIEKIAKDQDIEDVERDLVITLLAKAKR